MTTEPRIAPLEPPYGDQLVAEFEKLMPPGMDPLKLFRTVGHNPRILHKFRQSSLLGPGSITPKEREIVILRTCARCGAEYEWGVHVAFFGPRVGLTADQIRATVHGQAESPVWSAQEALLIRLADELHDTRHISDELWQGLAAHWQNDQVIELITLTGLYQMISFMVNGLQVELEANAPTFPPAG